MKVTTYTSTSYLNCSGCGDGQAFICVPMDLLSSGANYLDVRIIGVREAYNVNSKKIYEYILEYDETLLVDPIDGIAPCEIRGITCRSCLTDYIDYRVDTVDSWVEPKAIWTTSGGDTIFSDIDPTTYLDVGNKIRLKQGTLNYSYYNVIEVTNTSFRVTGGSDYSLASALLTDTAYSGKLSPKGFPPFFNYTPALVGWSVLPTISKYIFYMVGTNVTVVFRQDGSSTSNTSNALIGLPVPAAVIPNMVWSYTLGKLVAGSLVVTSGYGKIVSGATVLQCFQTHEESNWATGDAKLISGSITYQMKGL